MRADIGCSCLASAFGTDYQWGDSVDQSPGVKGLLITDLPNQAEGIPDPEPYSDGRVPEGPR